jgi:membrane protein DedA with SNARE-associated domain
MVHFQVAGPSKPSPAATKSRIPRVVLPSIAAMAWVYHTIRHLLISWGYWTVSMGVAGESAGFPVPGEATLMLASFLSRKHSGLRLQWVILVGIAASVAGDNLGFFLGRRFGRVLIRWVQKIPHVGPEDIEVGRELIRRHEGRAVFFARFIFVMRTVAGTLAGSFGMEWGRFLKYNALGAAVWATCMASIGYLFAGEFSTLLDYIEKASWGVSGGLFALGYILWRRYKSGFRVRHSGSAA